MGLYFTRVVHLSSGEVGLGLTISGLIGLAAGVRWAISRTVTECAVAVEIGPVDAYRALILANALTFRGRG
jgi:hypothetical protein